jgi:hypothetical protein
MWHSSRHFLLYCHDSYKLFVRLLVHHPFSFCFCAFRLIAGRAFSSLFLDFIQVLCPVSSSPVFYWFTHCSLPFVGELFSPLFWEIIQTFLCLFHSLFAVELFLLHFWNSYKLFCLAFSLLFYMASNITEAVS